MEQDEATVAGRLQVELHEVGPESDRFFERRQGVLGCVPRGSAMVGDLHRFRADLFESLPRDDFLGEIGLNPVDAGGRHAVPDFGPVVRLRASWPEP